MNSSSSFDYIMTNITYLYIYYRVSDSVQVDEGPIELLLDEQTVYSKTFSSLWTPNNMLDA